MVLKLLILSRQDNPVAGDRAGVASLPIFGTIQRGVIPGHRLGGNDCDLFLRFIDPVSQLGDGDIQGSL